MSYLAEIRKLTGNQAVFFLMFIGALIAPGVLIIWRFAPHIIEKGDSSVILLLASAIGLAITVMNLVGITLATDVDNFDDTSKALNQLGLASGMTVIMTSLFLFIDLIFGLNLSAKRYADFVFGFTFVLLASVKISRKYDLWRESKKVSTAAKQKDKL